MSTLIARIRSPSGNIANPLVDSPRSRAHVASSSRRTRVFLTSFLALIILCCLATLYMAGMMLFRSNTSSVAHKNCVNCGNADESNYILSPMVLRRSPSFDASVSRQRGLVLPMREELVPLGMSLIRELRCLGNEELIQVYYCLHNELSVKAIERLMELDNRVEIIDVCTKLVKKHALTFHQAAKFVGDWVKPLAVYDSDLEEIIMVDPSVFLLQDPAAVRSLDGYRQTGTTFFYDRVLPGNDHLMKSVGSYPSRSVNMLHHLLNSFDYERLNISRPNERSAHLLSSLSYANQSMYEMDASMVIMNKKRAGKAMQVLWHLVTQTRDDSVLASGYREVFWLAYEMAQVDYFFSPWAPSAVSSWPNKDMEKHPMTLCGSMSQYMPVDTRTPELLYANGHALIDFRAGGLLRYLETKTLSMTQVFNVHPTHVSPPHRREEQRDRRQNSWKLWMNDECILNTGSVPIQTDFHARLLRRRMFFLAVHSNVKRVLNSCRFGPAVDTSNALSKSPSAPPIDST